jgi:hypothetical protein
LHLVLRLRGGNWGACVARLTMCVFW